VKLIRTLQVFARDLIEVCVRRKRAVFATAATVLLLSVLGCFPLRNYTASTVILMDTASSDLQTEADALQSAKVARKVIQDMNLERDLEEAENFNPPFNPVYGALGLIAPRHPAGPAGLDHPSASAVRALRTNVRVTAEPGARLLRVAYTHRDPLVATAVVNDLRKTYLDDRQQIRMQATNQLAHWLQGRLAELGKQNVDLQARVVATQPSNGRTAILLSQAQMNSMVKASAAQVARTGSAELIAQLSPTFPEKDATPLLQMQDLLHQQKTLQAQMDHDATGLGTRSVVVTQERASMKSLERSLQAEVNRIKERTQHDFEAASTAEQRIRTIYEAQRTAAEKRNGQGLEYAALSQQADQSHQLYEDLRRRLQKTAAIETPYFSQVTVTDQVSIAMLGKTAFPLYLAFGVMVGVLLACCVALLVESIGDRPRKNNPGALQFEEWDRLARLAVNHSRYDDRGVAHSVAHEGCGRWAHKHFMDNGWDAKGGPIAPSSGMTLLLGRGGATKPSVTPARAARFGVINGGGEATRAESGVSLVPKQSDSGTAGQAAATVSDPSLRSAPGA
jgi:uncharacterized protein involved in exopolysaccharide biosynthesis